jgi:nucleotidyltransferase/DNA polymerase involved in DNA repair
VAHNKFLAKLASDLQKPDGLTVLLEPEQIERVLPPLPISRIWGIGPKTAIRLNDLGIKTIGDIRKLPLDILTAKFGDEGERYFRLSRGIDDREVTPDSQAKSIGQEQTFGVDVADPEELRGVLLGEIEQIAARLRRHGLRTRGITLKIRDGQFNTITRAAKVDPPTSITQPLWEVAQQTFDAWATTSFKPLRLLGAQATHLTADAEQLPLFEDSRSERHKKVDAALDQINARLGKLAIHRARAKPRRRDQE